MNLYLDTSLLVAALTNEAESGRIQQWLGSVDKSLLEPPEPRRVRDKAYLKFLVHKAASSVGGSLAMRIICALRSSVRWAER